MSAGTDLPLDADLGPHEDEPHQDDVTGLLNWLRAAVLGANDGIVSVAGLVMGVAGATTDRQAIFVAGIAGLVSGALSMAAGEYVSVSTQRDTEEALLAKEARELEEEPEEELAELAGIYRDKGLSEELALRVAEELTAHDALAAHAEAELGIHPDGLTRPWQAAIASLVAFSLGGALPLITILLFGQSWRVGATVVAVVFALALTGFLSARFAEADVRRAMLRNVLGGVLAMAITYGIGRLVGTQIR
jgi:VIT1/CCC1 family predicted Fe2+/Mn2+ transporter